MTKTIEEIHEQCLTEILIEIDKLLSRMESVEETIGKIKANVVPDTSSF